ncbi:BsaA family SipW-dependent biofilm matrix protein [Vagococcus zengguangii]|uniref:Uncharacterized protein n=1 Tax=Vagococcus zengguangii TaxID=2571750 RepID=A0A4D7CSA8_9ENTE|nr:BsaA family SipW-dependent biofilm matrix protein [Vagococcus zengguangii]QCI85923.1 hypothetical protein FA707_02640 [Vagococcus zengguangii]TLG78317.1 hypothetical protein FE258_09455 [Vagococcus zengguangii]
MKKNKKKLLAGSALGLVLLFGGTYAWFTSQDEVTNHFEGQIAGNDIQIVETYEPETNWEPGEEVNKDVAVANVSEYNAFTRVAFDEILKLLKDSSEVYYNGQTYVNKAGETIEVAMPLVMNSSMDYLAKGYTDVTAKLATEVKDITVNGKTYKFQLFEKAAIGTANQFSYGAVWMSGTEQAKAYIGNTSNLIARAADGTLSFNGIEPTISVVDKTYADALTANWTNPVYGKTPINDLVFKSATDDNIELNFVNVTNIPTEKKWFFNQADGYFYFVGKVASGDSTAQLLDSVKLLGSAGNQYSLFTFDLNVKAEGIQSISEAVTDNWPTASSELSSLLQTLADN